jgi:hypothetical protein
LAAGPKNRMPRVFEDGSVGQFPGTRSSGIQQSLTIDHLSHGTPESHDRAISDKENLLLEAPPFVCIVTNRAFCATVPLQRGARVDW